MTTQYFHKKEFVSKREMGLLHTIMPVNSALSVASMGSLSTTFFLQAILLCATSLCSFARVFKIAAMFCLQKLEKMTQGLMQGFQGTVIHARCSV